MILPMRQLFFSESVKMHPSGSGRGNVYFFGAMMLKCHVQRETYD